MKYKIEGEYLGDGRIEVLGQVYQKKEFGLTMGIAVGYHNTVVDERDELKAKLKEAENSIALQVITYRELLDDRNAIRYEGHELRAEISDLRDENDKMKCGAIRNQREIIKLNDKNNRLRKRNLKLWAEIHIGDIENE